MRSQQTRRGFTLIEVMITVAIIGIMAAIAIPVFATYQNRSRRTEAMSNVAAIAKAEIAYFGAGGVYRGTIPVPGPPLSATKRQWDAASKAEFDPLGYQPEGAVYYDYEVNTTPGDCGGCPIGQNGEALCFTVAANGDVDADGFLGVVAYYKRDNAGNTCSTLTTALPFIPDQTTGLPAYERPIAAPAYPPFVIADDF